jgi:uracil-DNA glycosylase family 4
VACERCRRLRAWCRKVAREKVRRFTAEEYWGRPVPGFGDPGARLLVVGLAPAAHGGNRTGRVFTGDRSGDFLFAALHRAGFASQPDSVARGDGLRLDDAWIAALVRCAPPANRPEAEEIDRCRGFLAREIALLPRLAVVLALGGVAWKGFVDLMRASGRHARPAPRFAHGAEAEVAGFALIGCYHPSQQNTFTGRLTPTMIDAVLARARAGLGAGRRC